MTPRFSLANMLLAITLICVCIAWYLDRTQLNKRYQANTASLKAVLGRVDAYDTESQPNFKQVLEKYSPQYRGDDTSYYRRERDDLKLDIERARELFSKLLRPLIQTEIK